MIEDRGYSSACWIWHGASTTKGYGAVTIAGRKLYAHRAMYEQEVGPIPAGLHLDHLCRQQKCVNPAHLEPVTPTVNLRRGNSIKLTDEQVTKIRLDPRPQVVIAAEYGVHSSHISRIQNFKNRRPD